MTARKIILIIAALVVSLTGGINSFAQVKRVQMRIGGYLCGN
jgi:hypothetical protein